MSPTNLVGADALLCRLAFAVDLNRLEVDRPGREEDLPWSAREGRQKAAEKAEKATGPGKEAALGNELLKSHERGRYLLARSAARRWCWSSVVCRAKSVGSSGKRRAGASGSMPSSVSE